jgi:threonine synthase
LEAVRAGASTVTTLPYARSRISGINVPFTGDHALAAIYDSGGTAAGVTDEEVWAMQQRLALEEGIWVEPAGAAPVAALEGLIERGEMQSDERIVCVLSGAGFKDASLGAALAERIGEQATTPFDVDEVVGQIQAN